MKEAWWPLICLAGASIGYVFFMGLSPLRFSMGNAYRLHRNFPLLWLSLALFLLLGSFLTMLPDINVHLREGFSIWGPFFPTSFSSHGEESFRKALVSTGSTFQALHSTGGILSLFFAFWLCLNMHNSFRIFGEECDAIYGKAGWPIAFAVLLCGLVHLLIPILHWIGHPAPEWILIVSRFFSICAAVAFQFMLVLYAYIWFRNPQDFAPLRVSGYLYPLLPKALPLAVILFATDQIWSHFLPDSWTWRASIMTVVSATCFACIVVALVIGKRPLAGTVILNFAMISRDLTAVAWIVFSGLLHWFLLLGLHASMQTAFVAFSLPNMIWQLVYHLLFAFLHVWLVSILVIRVCEHLKFPRKRRRF